MSKLVLRELDEKKNSRNSIIKFKALTLLYAVHT